MNIYGSRDNYSYNPGASVFNELITLYCVRYDPYYCTVDPETIWQSIRDHGGGCHSRPAGSLDFYVPASLISLVLLRDSALKIVESNSYI